MLAENKQYDKKLEIPVKKKKREKNNSREVYIADDSTLLQINARSWA